LSTLQVKGSFAIFGPQRQEEYGLRPGQAKVSQTLSQKQLWPQLTQEVEVERLQSEASPYENTRLYLKNT
jgi:hypothetical protein